MELTEKETEKKSKIIDELSEFIKQNGNESNSDYNIACCVDFLITNIAKLQTRIEALENRPSACDCGERILA